MKQSNQTVFYLIEKAIKEYRKHCLRNIKAKIKDLTVDQTMLIFMIQNEPDLNQKELASILFKDTASITRMIELMVNKGYLTRSNNEEDRRQFKLTTTKKAEKAIKELEPVIKKNRKEAVNGITDKELENLKKSLNKLISNIGVYHQS